MSTYQYGKIMSKYCIQNPGSDAAGLNSSLWRHFVDTVYLMSSYVYFVVGKTVNLRDLSRIP